MQYPYLFTVLLPLYLTIPLIVWAGEFEDQLNKVGIFQETIDILLKQEFSKMEDLQTVTIDSLVKMGIKYEAAQKIVVNFGETKHQPFEKMSLSDLLSYLLTNPTDEHALQALKQSKEVQQAEAQAETTEWAVVGMTDKKLNIPLTIAYLELLTQSPPRSVFRDKPVVSIEVALGKVEAVIREHPLLEETLATNGLDHHNLNWLKVPVAVRKALFWAKIINHPQFPTQPEQVVLEVYKEATNNPLTVGIVQTIVTEYQAALLRQDPTAINVRALKMPE